ncbi:VCBS repeat-containing protein [Streptomyces phyllanthi]
MAALVAAALGVGLLVPDWSGSPEDSAAKKPDRSSGPLDEQEARRKAVATGKRVEATALRDATSTTYAKPDGTFELHVSSAPVRAEVDGEWKPINTTLRRVKGGWAPEAAAEPVVFSDGSGSTSSGTARGAAADEAGAVRPAVYAVSRNGGSDTVTAADENTAYTELVTMTSGEHQITVSWPGALPTPAINGAQALYRDVFPDVDLLLTARDSGFGHVLIVHDAQAAANPDLEKLSYGLSSPDLVFKLDENTKVVTAVDGDGTEYAVSPTPMMWDSAGAPAVTEGADPQPAEPSDEPEVSTSESAAPNEDGARETGEPSGGLDTDAPADPAAHRQAHRGTGTGKGAGAVPAAYRQVAERLTDTEVFALTGLAGPDPGTHLAVADADLSAPGTTDTALTIAPKQSLLTDDDTEWPVFVDPSFTGPSTNWTTAYKKYPTSSFYDGANYNSGTTEARVGYEATTWGTSRSFFRLKLTNTEGTRKLKGAYISSAKLRTLETYSWSCSGRVVELWHTGSISSSTTWNNQPDWKSKVTSRDVAHGYSSSCPDEYVEFDTKSLVQDAADSGWYSVTLGLRAYDETSAYPWKKFKAEGEKAPKLVITYNHKPTVSSTSLDMSPGPGCDRVLEYPTIGKRDLTLSANANDADGDESLDRVVFQLWRTNYSSTTLIEKTDTTPSATGQASVTFPASTLTNGWTYSWQVQARDNSGASSSWYPINEKDKADTCRFVFDSSVPDSPLVLSDDFPKESPSGDVWSVKKLGEQGAFTFATDETDVTAFRYGFNTGSCTSSPLTAGSGTYVDEDGTSKSGKKYTLTTGVPLAGPNVLYVCAQDSAGNLSSASQYVFYVTPRDQPDEPGDVTGDGYADLFVINEYKDLAMYSGSSTGDLHRSLNAAHDKGTPLDCDLTAEADDIAENCWTDATGTQPALIAHYADSYPGDGMTDLFARMPDDELYLYKGDGYGSIDTSKRLTVYLPDGSPDPATFTQMIVADYDLDKRPDLFATTDGGGMWAFTGYSGASFGTATKIATTAWEPRDLVSVGDHDKDGAPDLLWRSETSDRLYLRYGVKDTTNGGATIASLSTAADSRTGADEIYAEGWSETAMPVRLIHGTPDATGDDIPDIWSLASDGSVKLYKGGASTIGTATTVISSSSGWGTTKLAFG